MHHSPSIKAARPIFPLRADDASIDPSLAETLQKLSLAATPLYVMQNRGVDDARVAYMDADGQGHYIVRAVTPVYVPGKGYRRAGDLMILEVSIFMRPDICCAI